MQYKLGKLPRTFNPKIPHMSALLSAYTLPPLPASVDWTKGITDFGMMLNDQLGCCTIAAYYHALQIWSTNTITEQTESDNCVLQLYEQADGYNPNNPSTDQGGVEQNVLSYLLNTGAPLNNGQRDKILAFIEVDPRNINDIKRTIYDCGVCYIGFEVPSNILDQGEPPAVWNVDPNDAQIEGGHAVVACGFSDIGIQIISWGKVYTMTYEFFSRYTDEAYAIADQFWIDSTGKTPLGMDLQQLEYLMHAIKE